MSYGQTKGLVASSLEMSSAEIIRARRACTVPQQLLRSYELPSLSSTLTVPKRYEETKPVKVQNFTHQRIIDLGEFINRQSREETEKIRQSAVEKAVSDTWEAAHEIKTAAVSDALRKAQVQHEKQLKRLARQHDRAIKQEALTVETMMQNKMRELVDEERFQAERKLEETVEQVKEQCAAELQEAVTVARKEEQNVANLERLQLLQEAAHKLDVTKSTLIEEKNVALKELETKKEIEKVKAVRIAHSEEQKIRETIVADLKHQNTLSIGKLELALASIEGEISIRDHEIERVQRKRQQLYDELIKVQADYQNFIDKHPLFDPGQTGYLLLNAHTNPNIINPHDEKVNPKLKGKIKWNSP